MVLFGNFKISRKFDNWEEAFHYFRLTILIL